MAPIWSSWAWVSTKPIRSDFLSTINPGSGYIKSIPGIVSSANVIPISTIAPRQRGIGYEPIVNLEMNLHPNMKEKLYCANKKIGRNVPEAEKYDKKYKCEG